MSVFFLLFVSCLFSKLIHAFSTEQKRRETKRSHLSPAVIQFPFMFLLSLCQNVVSRSFSSFLCPFGFTLFMPLHKPVVVGFKGSIGVAICG